ncbi:MAG: formylglycine-generating enzyme family protein [Planctomycetota bacterium]
MHFPNPLVLLLGTWLFAAGCEDETPAPSPEPIVDAAGLSLAYVPPGELWMGSAGEEVRANETPRHRVRISKGFYLGRHEVTVGQFRRFVEATGHVTDGERDPSGGFGFDPATGRFVQRPELNWRQPGFAQNGDHPVVQVSWQDAEAFCRWLSEREGAHYRLPTEAEWEYACRGGTGLTYASGAGEDSLAGGANVADRSLAQARPWARWAHDWSDGHAFTAPVGQYAPNAFGLFDMTGNVWEWCADWHDEAYYERSPSTDPRGPEVGTFRAIRGGGWFDPAERSRAAMRIYFPPTFRYCQLSGFRVLREL